MPQGKVIAVTPLMPNKGMNSGELNECDGTVEVLDGAYKGRILPFKENGNCCRCEGGEEVTIEITELSQGKLKVKITDCKNCK